tara:strand:+ start:7171 stop:8454 length:1284 start_codon:yes stop_codon:yes gene_type:complete
MHFFIPRSIMLRTWHDYNKYSIFYACRQIISNRLMLNGIKYTRNNRVYTPSLEIQDTVYEHWETFIVGFVKQVIAFGFALVIVMEDSTGRKYPNTVDPHLVDISVTIEDNYRTYTIHSTEIDPERVMVYDQYGFSPVMVNGTGMLTSLAWKVLPEIRFLSGLRNDCLLMESNKSNPHFFSVTHAVNRDEVEGIDFDYYSNDMVDVEQRASDRVFVRNKINVDVLNRQKDLYEQQRGYTKAVCKLENVVPLPTGTEIAQTPQNTGRQDIVQLHKVMQEMICTTLGVPRAILIADGQYSSSTEGVKLLFETTIKWWRKSVETTITDLFTKIYISNIKPQKNIYLAKQRQQVRLTLPPIVEVDLNQMRVLYDTGVINWDIYSKTVVMQLQLPEEGRNKTPPLQHIDTPQVLPVTHKRKRSAGGGDMSPRT